MKAGAAVVSVRKMHEGDAAAVSAIAAAAGDAARDLTSAVARDPHSVRVVHMGHEVIGAFLLAELQDRVEEVSCITLNDAGRRSGAEPLVLDYVVRTARFSQKAAVDVVPSADSSEPGFLKALGFERSAGTKGEGERYRLRLKGK